MASLAKKSFSPFAAVWRWLGRRLSFLLTWFKVKLMGLSPRSAVTLLGGLVGLVLFYYLIGMFLTHRINTDPDYGFGQDLDPGASRAVHVTQALVRRELDYGWVSNDPFFYPVFPMDNMGNFQEGLFEALSRFTFELRDQLGRNRGSSGADTDLVAAAGDLAKSGRDWVAKLPSPVPQTPSETFYRRAAEELERYNKRVASGDAVFAKRSDNLLNALDRIGADLGDVTNALDEFMAESAGDWGPNYGSDDIFYVSKGKAYGYYMILRGLREDYAQVLDESDLAAIYDEMLLSLGRAAGLNPWMVMNGQLDGWTFPNHLSGQGFHLLRARLRLREITNILLK